MKKNKKRVTKKAVRQVFFIAMFTVIMTIAILMIFNSFNIKLEEETVLVQYRNVSNIDYNVNYKANNVYNDTSLSKGGTYISDLIDNIEANFSYDLNTRNKGTYNYTYRIVAELSSNYQSSGEVWHKDFILVDNIIHENEDNVNISEIVNINYPQYIEEINNYQKTVNLDIDTNLAIKMYIDINGSFADCEEPLTEHLVLQLDIPATQEVFNISEQLPSIKSNFITKVEQHGMVTNIYYFISGALLLVVSVIVIITQFKDFFSYGRITSNYIKKVSKYLSDYDNLIIELKKIPDLSNLNIIEVRSFSELLDVRKNIQAPITFAERIPLEEGWFMIIDNNQVYRYILKDN